MSTDEASFLASYNIEDYFRPSVTADVLAFCANESGLSLLMIKRKGHPFKGAWALPGGFLQKDETLEQCALRETQEETGVMPSSLIPIGIFSDVDRDPRGRIISQAYAAIINDESIRIVSGDDACDAKWFSLSFDDGTLTLKNGELCFYAKLIQTQTTFDIPQFKITENNGIAFDHAAIIASAVSLLRSKAASTDIVFDFLPENFTLTQLQRVLEAILGKRLIAANFRRKFTPLVTKTDRYAEGHNHRPARLFKRTETQK